MGTGRGETGYRLGLGRPNTIAAEVVTVRVWFRCLVRPMQPIRQSRPVIVKAGHAWLGLVGVLLCLADWPAPSRRSGQEHKRAEMALPLPTVGTCRGGRLSFSRQARQDPEACCWEGFGHQPLPSWVGGDGISLPITFRCSCTAPRTSTKTKHLPRLLHGILSSISSYTLRCSDSAQELNILCTIINSQDNNRRTVIRLS